GRPLWLRAGGRVRAGGRIRGGGVGRRTGHLQGLGPPVRLAGSGLPVARLVRSAVRLRLAGRWIGARRGRVCRRARWPRPFAPGRLGWLLLVRVTLVLAHTMSMPTRTMANLRWGWKFAGRARSCERLCRLAGER